MTPPSSIPASRAAGAGPAGNRADGDEAALRDQIDLLVRPGRQSLAPGEPEARLREETGSGSGRIGKDTVTSMAILRSTVLAAAREAELPLLVSVNQEGGRLNALDWPGVVQMPGGMALGAVGSEDLAEQAGAAIGGQLRAAGLTWNLAPSCDLAGWPSGSAIGTRAFGSGPGQVAALVAAFTRGLQGAGVAATAKHFPGLGGAAADPHHQAPVIGRLPDGALEPFLAAIEAGVTCVMAGSHTVRSVDARPALASPPMMALLREDLGFGGVVVTENLSIPAVCQPLGGLAGAAVAAIAAGADVIMLDSEVSRGRQPHRQRAAVIRARGDVTRALARAVRDGQVSRSRIEEAARRVLALHRRFGIGAGTPLPGWDEANTAALHVAGRIADESVTVLRGADLLPLVPASGTRLATVRVPDAGERRADSARYAPDLFPGQLAALVPAEPSPAGGSGDRAWHQRWSTATTPGPGRASSAARRKRQPGSRNRAAWWSRSPSAIPMTWPGRRPTS